MRPEISRPRGAPLPIPSARIFSVVRHVNLALTASSDEDAAAFDDEGVSALSNRPYQGANEAGEGTRIKTQQSTKKGGFVKKGASDGPCRMWLLRGEK